MNILLIRPRPDRETIGLQHVMICEPLELLYIASNIDYKDAFNIDIVDMIIEKKPLEYFIKKYEPDIVGMSGYITHVNIIKKYASIIKSYKSDCKIVIGGVHAEVVPEDFLHPDIDYIIEANGLKTFNDILNNRSNIEGIFVEGKKAVKEKTFQYNFPDRKKVERYRHKYYYMFHNPCALIKTSYGCPYSCSFCFCKEITGGQYFTRSIASVIEELKQIPEREIYIVDDDFLFSRDRLLEFCHELKINNIKKNFLVYGRADFIAQNEDVIRLFKSNGLGAVIVGLESFKEEALDNYNKRSGIAENERAVRILKELDIEVYSTLILDMDFSREDFDNLYKWIKKLGLYFVNLQPLTPLPGTEIFDKYKEHIIISRKEYEKWDLAHLVLKPSKMTARQYYFQIIRLYYRVIMSPQNVLRLIRKYGFWQVFKLSIGSSMVTIQYIKKFLKGK